MHEFFDKLFERDADLLFWKNNLWFILVVEVLAKCAKTLMNFPGHDNIYVHCFIRRTSLFCGSFEEQPRRIILKRFRLTLHFSACRILAWRTIPDVFINEVRWLLRSQHDSMSSTHQIKLLIYTVLRLLWNLNIQFWDYCEISICGPFVYRLGRKILNLERAVRFCYGLR